MSRFLPAVLVLLAIAACGDGGAGGEAVTSTPTRMATPTTTRTARTATASPSPVTTPTLTPVPTAEPTPASTWQPTQPPPTQAPGVTLLEPVSKQHALPADYVPPGLTLLPTAILAPGFGGQQLRVEAAAALEEMLAAAGDEAGLEIRARSSYRSYAEQEATFQYWVDLLGLEQAERVSARPGHSEHQLGAATDLTAASVGWQLTEGFGGTAEGQWLAANAYRFGFALSYPEDKEPVTGYSYEPWHWRYIGIEHASAWRASGLTLIEYLEGL